jgi:ATP-dependent DNA helicase RecG
VNETLLKPITYLKGVGPERGEALTKEAGVDTVWDLLNYFPFRYIDRSKFDQIRTLTGQEGNVQLKGVIKGVKLSGVRRSKRLTAIFSDGSGSMELIWFKGINWIQNKLTPGKEYIVYGKIQNFKGVKTIAHPDFGEFSSQENITRLQPVYNTSEKLTKVGLHSKGIEKLMHTTLKDHLKLIHNIFPEDMRNAYQLLSRSQAYRCIHHAFNHTELKKAQYTLKFEELFILQMEMLLRKRIGKKAQKGIQINGSGDAFKMFYDEHLPFSLTNAQKRVVKEIFEDLKSGERMNRLLQGDVGSGKTLVAILSCLFMIGNGYQTAIMAPTEILAQQHFNSVSELLAPIGINVALLTGSKKPKERKLLHEALVCGEIDLLIGTHALIEPTVKFYNLGLVIIDEQHRFGVAQRAKLANKNTLPPHVLVMTATPIPRTLSLTFYGDLDVSVIDELPAGRKPIQTVHYFEAKRLVVFDFIRKQIEHGRQVYIVYPLIQESETLDYKNLMEGYEAVSRSFPRPDYQISIVHGQMKPEDKEFEMQRFVKGETQIMVATTVIEVGVNVPNASVMVIENAERFGLSQLHQLRGRVGRGSEKSYCILMSGEKLSENGKKRLSTMVQTNDGFKIAEVDLELRGPGDIMGTQQSGILNLNIANLATDGIILNQARKAAKEILAADPSLENIENERIKWALKEVIKSKPNWSKIA